MKVILLLIICVILLAPLLLDKRLKVKRGRPVFEKECGKRTPAPRWRGPKTDERMNRMLAESITTLEDLGVPISDSICPEVILTGFHSFVGRCCPKGSSKKYTDYDFYIEISGFSLNNTEKSQRNILLHELIHTVPGGLTHTGEWKKWAEYVSEKLGYNIQRYGNDETEQDRKNLAGRC